MEFVDYPAIAKAYATAVVAGTNLVCREVTLACQRYLKMLAMAEDPKNDFIFEPYFVIDYCSFVEKLRHFEGGTWENTQRADDGISDPRIILEPWQIWVESAIHGFRNRTTRDRLVEIALEVVPRKNAKSLKAVAAGLYDLCCSSTLGPEIPIAAATARQADDTLFGDLLKMCGREPELVEKYHLKMTSDEIRSPTGRIFKLTSMGERQDGLNPSLALFEEGHAGASAVYSVVMSAFGARPNALLRMITTAGYRPEGPAWNMIQEAMMVLEGTSVDYSFFAAIYTLDKTDYLNKNGAIDWERLLNNPALLPKANPMYGVSLDVGKINGTILSAKRMPSKRGELARTRYNIWTGSGTSLIEQSAWAACSDPTLKLESFVGEEVKCWIGVDLAQYRDMCAIGILFEISPKKLAVFARFFLPRESETATDPELIDRILEWEEGGWLTLTEGPMADHDRVREEVDAFCSVFQVQVIACDPAQAHNTAKQLWDGQRPVMVYPNNAYTMTAPTDDLLGRIASQTIVHDGNPVLAWNVANVHGERKGNGLILPRKEDQNSKRKIDGFVAVCFANGVRLQPTNAKTPQGESTKPTDPYLNRGIIGYEVMTNVA